MKRNEYFAHGSDECNRDSAMGGNTVNYAFDLPVRYEISSEAIFYTVNDIAERTGWSRSVVLQLFKDPEFPSANLGKAMIVETHALIEYFSRKRTKSTGTEWTKGELRDELRKRIR